MKGTEAKDSGRTASGQWVTIRVFPEEKKRLAAQAAIAGLSVSEYLRRRFFGGRPIIAKTDLAVVSELRRLGGLLKSHFDLLRQHGANREIFQAMELTLRNLAWEIQRMGLQ